MVVRPVPALNPSLAAAPAGPCAAGPSVKHMPRAPQGSARPGDISGRQREGGTGIERHNQGLITILIAARLPQHLDLDPRTRIQSRGRPHWERRLVKTLNITQQHPFCGARSVPHAPSPLSLAGSAWQTQAPTAPTKVLPALGYLRDLGGLAGPQKAPLCEGDGTAPSSASKGIPGPGSLNRRTG